MPFYGNTHTTTSVTSLQTTLFRHEARDIFRNATNAAEEDAVIFTGSGTTAAVHKLINAMALHQVCLSLINRFKIEYNFSTFDFGISQYVYPIEF